MGVDQSALKDVDLKDDTIRLSDADIGPGVAKTLSSYLATNVHVRNLYLSWNNLGDLGSKWVGRMLQTNYCLRLVDLSANGIRNEGPLCQYSI